MAVITGCYVKTQGRTLVAFDSAKLLFFKLRTCNFESNFDQISSCLSHWSNFQCPITLPGVDQWGHPNLNQPCQSPSALQSKAPHQVRRQFQTFVPSSFTHSQRSNNYLQPIINTQYTPLVFHFSLSLSLGEGSDCADATLANWRDAVLFKPWTTTGGIETGLVTLDSKSHSPSRRYVSIVGLVPACCNLERCAPAWQTVFSTSCEIIEASACTAARVVIN